MLPNNSFCTFGKHSCSPNLQLSGVPNINTIIISTILLWSSQSQLGSLNTQSLENVLLTLLTRDKSKGLKKANIYPLNNLLVRDESFLYPQFTLQRKLHLTLGKWKLLLQRQQGQLESDFEREVVDKGCV